MLARRCSSLNEYYSTNVYTKLSKHKLCDSNMCHFSDQNKKDNGERMIVRKKKLPFRATFSQGYEKIQ